MNIERVWWMALVLSGALVLHLFMFTGVPQPPADAAGHAGGMAQHAAPPTSGHDGGSTTHDAATMLSTCFAVLALVTAGAGASRATRARRTDLGLHTRSTPPGWQVGDATSMADPSRLSRVDAGVLLRV